MVRALRDRENIQTVGKYPSPPPHLPLKHLCFIVFGSGQLRNSICNNNVKYCRKPKVTACLHEQHEDEHASLQLYEISGVL
jgi:hypothetical protein